MYRRLTTELYGPTFFMRSRGATAYRLRNSDAVCSIDPRADPHASGMYLLQRLPHSTDEVTAAT